MVHLKADGLYGDGEGSVEGPHVHKVLKKGSECVILYVGHDSIHTNSLVDILLLIMNYTS